MARPTNEELFRNGITVYQNDEGNYVLELWGASTKHPDSIFHFEDFQKCEWIDNESQIFQWLCECASKLTFPSHARELVKYAMENF